MKKCISIIVLLSLVCIVWAQEKPPETEVEEEGWEEGYHDGKIAGEQVNQSKWMIYGCGGGLLGGCLGAGGCPIGKAVYAMPNSGDSPQYIPKGSSEYKQGYIEGYEEATKKKKVNQARIGRIVGTVMVIVIGAGLAIWIFTSVD